MLIRKKKRNISFNYTNRSNNPHDSFIVKLSPRALDTYQNYKIDWLKYLDFGGSETHNYFDINNAGELIMGITIDNESSGNESGYIMKAYDNGTIIN